MAKIRRRGEPQVFSSSADALPPTHERVRRLIELEGVSRPRVDLRALRAVEPMPARLPARMLVSESVLRPRGRRIRLQASLRCPVAFHQTQIPFTSLRVPRSLFLRAPFKVRFCVQRKVRKEVLFAKRKVGFRGSSPGRGGRYGRRGDSAYSCR